MLNYILKKLFISTFPTKITLEKQWFGGYKWKTKRPYYSGHIDSVRDEFMLFDGENDIKVTGRPRFNDQNNIISYEIVIQTLNPANRIVKEFQLSEL